MSHRVPRGRAYDPWEHAEILGLTVIVGQLRTANELWLPDRNTIIVRSSMRAAWQRVALAHGIGHAALAHVDDRPKHEHQADRFASLYLIDPSELRELTLWSDDAEKVAGELGVTRRVLNAYLSFQRAG